MDLGCFDPALARGYPYYLDQRYPKILEQKIRLHRVRRFLSGSEYLEIINLFCQSVHQFGLSSLPRRDILRSHFLCLKYTQRTAPFARVQVILVFVSCTRTMRLECWVS